MAHPKPTLEPVTELGRTENPLWHARVLLVEDNEFNRQVAMELLSLKDVHVEEASNGREAIERLDQKPFDAVLMDLQMPVMDGYEATRILRADPTHDDLPILAMTAHAMVQERERCQALGMNDYITKPIDPQELFTKLARWIAPSKGASREDSHNQTTGSSPIDLPGITWDLGLKCFSGNPDLYQKMLKRFVEIKSQTWADIQAAILRGDRDNAILLAHSMIAVAGSIGARQLSHDARALQHALQEGVPANLDTALKDFEASYTIVFNGLSSYFDETPTASKG